MHQEPRAFRNPPPRYGSAPLPAEPYLPGRGGQRPARGRQGSGPLPGECLLPRERWQEQGSYLHGVDLFNHAFWWEAHEAWEGLWSRAEGTQRLFLQGLIQLAAALLKHRLQSRKGCVRLAVGARDKLFAVHRQEQLARGERFMGIDLPTLLEAIDTAFAPVFQAERLGPLPLLAAPLVLELTGS